MSEANEDVVRFTAKELLARLDVKLDELVKQVDVRISALQGQVNQLDKQVQSTTEFRVAQVEVNRDRESRLRSLEKRVVILSVTAATGGAAGASLVNQLIG